MAIKVSFLFQVTTQVNVPDSAIPHSGGWSESHWSGFDSFVSLPTLTTVLQARRNLLPVECSIVGVRQGKFTLVGNKLLPGGTSNLKVVYPGNPTYNVNLPQDSLEMAASAIGSINASRFRIGALPDSVVLRGEYAPTTAYKSLVTQFGNALTRESIGWGFIGRNLANPSVRVLSIVPGVGGVATITLSGPLGFTVNQTFFRLNRVRDAARNAVRGAFVVTGNPAGTSYTIAGYTGQIVSAPSGNARVDEIRFCPYNEINPQRAVIKKIGRPFEGYRGRQSRRARV